MAESASVWQLNRIGSVVDHLLEYRLLQDPRLEQVLLESSPADFTDEPFVGFAGLELAYPSISKEGVVRLHPTYQWICLVFQLLELERGHDVLLLGSRGGWLETIIKRYVNPGVVVVVDRSPVVIDILGSRVNDVQGVVGDPMNPGIEEEFDAILVTGGTEASPPDLDRWMKETGIMVATVGSYEKARFEKRIRRGPLRTDQELGSVTTTPLDTGHEVGLEMEDYPAGTDVAQWMKVVALNDRLGSRDEIQRAAAEVFESMSIGRARRGEEGEEKADFLFRLGYVLQVLGSKTAANMFYELSIAEWPSAEAYTFIGWIHSFEDRYDEAIRYCKLAIETDPDFGNPYNDIGSYMIEQGRFQSAIPWLEKAIHSVRYDSYFFAHSNLARAHLALGHTKLARESFEKALELNPDYPPAKRMIERMDSGEEGPPDRDPDLIP